MNEDQLHQSEMQVREAQLQADQSRLNSLQQDFILQEQDKGMVNEQLNLQELLESIYNLLQGYVLERNEDGITEWKEPENKDMIILSEYGVNYIMGAVQWYLNKNTLLSNYDDAQINVKMEDLATTLTDDVFMEYDKMFCYPTLEDCKKEIRMRIKNKTEIRKFALELLGKEADEKEIENQILLEMENRIERELDIIREQKIKNKLKRFESIMRFIQDAIHSTYQRAWKGQERTTLRQHTHITENRGMPNIQQPQSNSFNPFGMLRRRT